ncbi:MAG: hypothetical protein A3F90_18410 [Deltaproteobacteria bacterium RIFCSPLOWO2_12_FULL_60_19]|nr:MAG: hypothetical protein A3F90_18410 [Deltaproteobacteria bacterium RIFCSPLOWO2_12_FULL_60_19]
MIVGFVAQFTRLATITSGPALPIRRAEPKNGDAEVNLLLAASALRKLKIQESIQFRSTSFPTILMVVAPRGIVCISCRSYTGRVDFCQPLELTRLRVGHSGCGFQSQVRQ